MSKFDRLDNKNTLEHYFLKIYYFKMSVKMNETLANLSWGRGSRLSEN